jgi:hypothetical protein
VSSGWHRRPKTQAELERRRQYASPEHQAQVAAVKAAVASGTAHCWRCGKHLPPGSKAHAGHDDHDRTVYRGPECPACNLRTAARKGNRMRNAQAQVTRGFTRPTR